MPYLIYETSSSINGSCESICGEGVSFVACCSFRKLAISNALAITAIKVAKVK